MAEIISFSWLGAHAPHLDQPNIAHCGSVVIGQYGGTSSIGSTKNEDGALVWVEDEGQWEFSMIVDAHHSADSAALMLRTLTIEKQAIRSYLSLPVGDAFSELQNHLTSRFLSPAFRTRCRFTEGEASCLITARKDRFLWWLSIGDCQAYLFNPRLAKLGEFALNQRSYYEWVGKANTFDLPVACFSSGIREMRQGANQIVLLTDGVLESGKGQFSNPKNLYRMYSSSQNSSEQFVQLVLGEVKKVKGRDSATMIVWKYHSHASGLQST